MQGLYVCTGNRRRQLVFLHSSISTHQALTPRSTSHLPPADEDSQEAMSQLRPCLV